MKRQQNKKNKTVNFLDSCLYLGGTQGCDWLLQQGALDADRGLPC